MKKTIKIAFVDFWNGFVPEESLFFKLLQSRYDVVLSDEPDFLFCSTFGEEHLRYDCVKIFYTGENQSPDFNLFDYALGFDRMEFGDRYMRFPIYRLYEDACAAMDAATEPDISSRNGFCSFVYSNNLASSAREEFFSKLNSYRPVSSGGRFRNNVGGPVADKVGFQSRHKFDIAFENCSQPGYVTEKLVQAFAAGTVPIYWGAPDVALDFNPEAFVNCRDYPSFDAVVERVKEIDSNDALWLRIAGAPARLSRPEPLEPFLFNIFDQNPSDAFRRSRVFWGKRYLEKARAKDKALRCSPRGIWNAVYKKTLWKWRRRNSFLWRIDKLFK